MRARAIRVWGGVHLGAPRAVGLRETDNQSKWLKPRAESGLDWLMCSEFFRGWCGVHLGAPGAVGLREAEHRLQVPLGEPADI